jgi:hypothetical protein
MKGSPHPATTTLTEGRTMQGTHTDRDDLSRLSDDGCPQVPEPTGDTRVYDLGELWRDLGGSD